MGIQIYDQVSILRSTSKVKLDRTILLGFGLKELKITLNIMKVGVYTYHPNVHQKIWSNFNFEKFVKGETPSCGFAKVVVKGGENILKRHEIWSAFLSIKWAPKSMIKFQLWENCQKWNFVVHFHYSSACILKGYPNLWSNFNSGNLVKSETPSCGFAKVWIKGWKKSSEHH